MSIIHVQNLQKDFRIRKKEAGSGRFLSRLISKQYETKSAVQNISFSINPGEMVGFIGPNGAGKSTTIKMLTGILVPTSGEILVNGRIPHKNRMENAAGIGVVFGQRTQLWWDIPLQESVELLKYVYKIPDSIYKENLRFLSDLLEIGTFMQTPVRQLSLGQRMRGDLLAALIHNPQILFLDEPTIGLDVIAKEKIRELLVNINRERKVSIMLTTHDMVDIEKTCNRMIIIDKGQLMYDGGLKQIKDRFGKQRKLIVDFKSIRLIPPINGVVVNELEGTKVLFQFHKDEISASRLIAMISEHNEISDLEIVEPEIDHIIREIYENGIEDTIPVNV
ncbi:ATP-binding cassette domain-containing protein [Paenibacillus sp. HN-1]|uniref:ABC transporter ATP-binding protein n=1 Tax=Paenibacillus TaxID=44249 RepID=UPI001CA95F3E|nr:MULTISPECIES: ATP-binding cassette domain-containing protein [Paenibacillus]MBY9080749.1 ATP-binding cassette domain-containing protein [Paenibacillus sp. CGMCC 1.18879]MBY9085259.1 ATP-binding cassette domain-containing protein [Paenibacillus sinensis]